MATLPQVPSFTLNNGHKMPAIGIGCWMGGVGQEREEAAENMVRTALRVGYRHFDTAAMYGSEEAVGKAISEACSNPDSALRIPREEVFVCTKLANTDHASVQEAFNTSLFKLGPGVGYIDLFLMHWPQAQDPSTGRTLQPDESPTINETWAEMEKLLETGKCKSIGVSNFSIKTLQQLLTTAKVVPAVNQVELHPALPQPSLLSFCTSHRILLTAYSPLGSQNQLEGCGPAGRSILLNDDALLEIAARYPGGYAGSKDAVDGMEGEKGIDGQPSATVAQVVLSWGVLRGTAVIPKTEREERMRENLTLLPLTPSDIAQIDDMFSSRSNSNSSASESESAGAGGLPFPRSLMELGPTKVAGWTYEQLGWDYRGSYVPKGA